LHQGDISTDSSENIQRATVGLDILAAIGSDIALMQLNGIAQKLKFKALQERAKEKIADIAESRELTVAELEDRLAQDLHYHPDRDPV
ncbi:hypothetical protein, partial [Klebsiella pneumoniae]|uniref:hypothetical protein n=1 Tax=Klebsiella pneumoniae TaxID=573 RepID=UPI00115DFFE7